MRTFNHPKRLAKKLIAHRYKCQFFGFSILQNPFVESFALSVKLYRTPRYQIIKSFGTDLNKLSYAEETAQLKKLIEELEKKENKAMLTALGLDATFAELKQKQTNFEAIFAEQANANADLRKMPSATAIRKTLEKSLRAYLDFLSVMQHQPQWNALYLEVSELVKAVKK